MAIDNNFPLVFLHVPKCGGTTISTWLEGVNNNGYNYIDLYPIRDLRGIELDNPDKTVICGHFLRHQGNAVEDRIFFDANFCTLLRDPFDILVSYYFWSLREGHEWANNLSINDFLEWASGGDDKIGYFKNPILDALPIWPQGEPIEEYISRFSVIRTISQIELFCSELTDLLKVNIGPIITKNRSHITQKIPDMRDRFREILRRDYELYDAVKKYC